jgi:hypothetical protein
MARQNKPHDAFAGSTRRDPLCLRNVEDLLFERAIDIHRESVRLWRS